MSRSNYSPLQPCLLSLVRRHPIANMGRCAYCQQTLFGDADRLFTQGQDEYIYPVLRIAAYRQCVVAAENYPTGPNRITQISVSSPPQYWRNLYNGIPGFRGGSLNDIPRSRESSAEYNPGNHDGLTMIGQCVNKFNLIKVIIISFYRFFHS